MGKGRTAANDYNDCMPTMIPIPAELHRALKIHCIETGTTMKEVLYDLNIKGIKVILGGKDNE